MNDQEFCGTICLAARRLQIGLGHSNQSKSELGFAWYDGLTGVTFRGESASDEKSALKNACEALVEYLNHTKTRP